MLMSKRKIKIKIHAEHHLQEAQRNEVIDLLRASFPEYPERQSFYPQPPHFRVLAWCNKSIVGHVGGVIRLIRLVGQDLLILGVTDLCVDAEYSRKRIASRMVNQLVDIAAKRQISYLMTIASEPDFYRKLGFSPVEDPVTWLTYHDGQSLGVFRQRRLQGFMVRPVSEVAWPGGDLDLRGPMF